MSKTLKILIVIINLIPITLWGYFVSTSLQDRSAARHLLTVPQPVEGTLDVRDQYVTSGKGGGVTKTIYGYTFAVEGKPYSGTVRFKYGTDADRTISHVPVGGPLSILYDQNDPDVNMPTDVARFYQTSSPWHLRGLFQAILLVNAGVVFLMWHARYRAARQ